MASPIPLVEPVTRATLPLSIKFSRQIALKHGTGPVFPPRNKCRRHPMCENIKIHSSKVRVMDTRTFATSGGIIRRPDRCDRIALVLQGGGALGAYQAGVYQALNEAGLEPDWISGVSIGGINAAIIAGNRVEDRLEALSEFWRRITDRTLWVQAPDGDIFRQWRNAFSAMTTMFMGQPGFFA